MKIPKTKLSKVQMKAIGDLLHQSFIQAIQESEYKDTLALPPSEWSKEATRFWDSLDTVTNQAVGKIESLLHL